MSILLKPSLSMGQKESAIWYFGDLAGLDFNYTPPKAISNPNMRTFEGCSSVSDSTGNILFYSDGRTVWNKKDSIMENGTNLLGDASSTHSSVILQKPFSANQYYIITADAWPNLTGDPNNGVNYSVVDMTLNQGNGKIVSKNNPLVNFSAEKIAITRHRNGVYAWLAIPECFSSNLHLFLVTENGIELKATYPNQFPVLQSSWGQIKFSPDGRHLALTWPKPNSQSSDVLIYDFNNSSGLLNQSEVISGGDKLYGLEFSPTSNFIYLSTWIDKKKVCQCEVRQGTLDYNTDCKFYPQRNVSGQLQLGPDQRIYIANSFKQYLGVIESPDSAFAKSSFVDSAIALLPGTLSYSGLPTIYTGYLTTEKIKTHTICLGDTASFSVTTNSFQYDSIRWMVDGRPTHDTISSGTYVFEQAGIHSISVILFQSINSDTFSTGITVKPMPINPHLSDTSVCQSQSVVLDAYRESGISYQWNNGSVDSAITALKDGLYTVILSKNGCSIENSLWVSYLPYPKISIPSETVICEGTSTQFSVQLPGASCVWSTGDTTSMMTTGRDDLYWVSVTQNSCVTRDSFYLHTTTLPNTGLGIDTTICASQVYLLNAFHPYSHYNWNTGATDSILWVHSPGLYSVTVENPCGQASDTVTIEQIPCDCFVWVPNAFTPNSDLRNDLFLPHLSCDYNTFDFRIYSKWGEEIFKSTNGSEGWDGKKNSGVMPADVYVWKLSCQLINAGGKVTNQNVSGTVTLLR
jgi:gliding motility-associated-like protein